MVILKEIFDLFVIIVVLIFASIPIVIIITAIYKTFNSNHRKKYGRYTPFSGSEFKVILKEFNEIPRLEKLLPLVTNKFCRQRTLMLYFTIQRKCRLPDGHTKDALLQLCKIAVLQELNYDTCGQTRLYGDYMEVLDNKKLCEDIKTMAHELICRIAWEDKDFYNACTDAWMIYYFQLRESFKPKNVQLFYDKVCWLAGLNGSITVKRKMYLDSYLFLVETDREYSLKFYLHYLGVSTGIKYRKITIKNSKTLFRKQDEKDRFDTICAELLRSENVSKALERFERMEISQRKKISLDIQAIKVAAEKQSKVSGVLSEWLTDDEEAPETTKVSKMNREENSVAGQLKNPKGAFFQLFIDSSYRISKEEVDIFARSRGFFTGQFVEKINDEHFEELDDVLIEETEEHYILNEAYCRQIRENGY